MNNKLLKIIGTLFMVAAVIFGYFAQFPGATVVEIAVLAFGLCSCIIASIRQAKDDGKFSWKTVVTIALACIAGVLCCIGGLSQNIFAEISAAVLAVLTLIFGLIYNK